MKRWQALFGGLVVFGAWASSSCSPANFQPETIIDTVRILASRATEPRAKPGDAVRLEVLAYDGRPSPTEKMKIFWLPIPCVNPAGDAYFACFAQFGGGGAAGSDAGVAPGSGGEDAGAGLRALRPGVDLTPLLVTGSAFSFTVPSHVIIPRVGVSPSYGLIILFNFACAGHLELLPVDPNNFNPQQIPIGCFDAQHNQLGPTDFVFGFTRLYAYEQSSETNPVITGVDMAGSSLPIDGGVTTKPFVTPPCTQIVGEDCQQKHPIGPIVPPSQPGGKQVWADFFSTVGKFTSNARLLYGPMVDLNVPGDTDNNFLPPIGPADGGSDGGSDGGAPKDFIWIVVHDDQGGADWVTVPLEIK